MSGMFFGTQCSVDYNGLIRDTFIRDNHSSEAYIPLDTTQPSRTLPPIKER